MKGVLMRFENYARPQSFEEALKILKEESSSRIIGGTTFLRLNKKPVQVAIDLKDLDIDFIRETENEIQIGAYTSLRELEINPIIKENFGEHFAKALKNIVGVQFRNVATIGGSVYGRYGFSDVISALAVLDCQVELVEHGMMDFHQFILEGKYKDIIKQIILKKNNPKTSYQMLRKSDADFPTHTCAASKVGDKVEIAVGSRPKAAHHALKAEEFLQGKELNSENIEAAADLVKEELDFGNDIRSSQAYKEQVVKVLVRRALEEVK